MIDHAHKAWYVKYNITLSQFYPKVESIDRICTELGTLSYVILMSRLGLFILLDDRIFSKCDIVWHEINNHFMCTFCYGGCKSKVERNLLSHRKLVPFVCKL
jgi:hypothetical protein